MSDLNALLSAHAADFPVDAVPADLAASLSRNLTDGLAAIVGGSNAPGVDELAGLVTGISKFGAAQVIAGGGRWPAIVAAQINATAGHALDFDDTLDEGGGMHAGALVHAATLAVADELGGVSGKAYLSAVAVGLDIAVRLALAPTRDFGWHRTSAFGIFGVVGAVGRLLGLNREQFANAFGIAYSQASGNRQCIADGALSKRLQAGFAARDGITAVHLGRLGVTGASRAFEGTDGFFTLYQRGEYRREVVTQGLGTDLLAGRIALKPYPCGRNLHALLDASFRARAAHGGRMIARIDVHVPAVAARHARADWPAHVVEAQFSVPFVLALSTQAGRTDLADFAAPDSVAPDVRALGDHVAIVPHVEQGAEDRIVFHYADGTRHSEAIEAVALGNPARPLDLAVVQDKFRSANRYVGAPLSDVAVERVLALAADLPVLADTRELTAALAI